MVTENINIDVRPGGIPIVIHVTQYEAGLRQFVFTPYTSNGTQTVVAGSATLEGTKPDGYAFQQACEMVDGVITYTLQEQLCAVEGRVWSRLVIRDTDGGMIGYTAIVWVVGRAGVADDAVMSDSDISALRQFLDEFGTIDAYRGALNGALAAVGGPLVASTATAMTDRTKVYVYTGSESGYTEGHWYYWSGSAWTDGGVYQSTGINTDKTITVEGMAADAKATGDAVAELKNELNLSPTKNLIDVFTPDAVNSAAVSMTADGDAKITALSNLTYLAAFYLIDTRDINKLTISYGSYAGTGSGNIRVGYVATPEDLPSSITWLSYLNNTNPKTYTVSAYDYIVIALYAVQASNPGTGNYMIYNHVQVEAGIVATEYMPHFVPADSVARDDIADINSTLVEIADDISSINATIYNPVSAVYAPDGYRWTDNPLNGKITEDFKNNVTVDYDISQHDPTTDAGTYYVDPIRGLSSNDGKTWETAFGNIATALQQSDVTCIMLREGFYNATKNLYNTVISKTVAIKGEAGKNVYIIQSSLTQMTADEDHQGVYFGSRGNCYGVIDLSVLNFDNDPTQYANVASVSEVYNTPGSWILTDGVLYVHTVDNRIPDADLILFRSGDNLHAIGDITLYLENLKVYGGNSPLWVENSSTIGGLRVFAKDCDFYYSYTTDNDAVMLQGAELSVFKNCRAKYAQKDGFNYHAKNAIIPHAIEINCTGAYNGNIEDSNDQGSTIHDAGSIIRINGLYHDNYGGNLADQGANTEAWMINCVAYKSIAPNSGQNANFFTYDDVKYWLDSCIGFASVSNVYRHNDGAQVNLRNCRFEGKLAPAGQEVTYY